MKMKWLSLCPCRILMFCKFGREHFGPCSQSSEDDFSLFGLVDPSTHGKKEFIATKAIISLTFTPHWEDRERERERPPPPLLPSFFSSLDVSCFRSMYTKCERERESLAKITLRIEIQPKILLRLLTKTGSACASVSET